MIESGNIGGTPGGEIRRAATSTRPAGYGDEARHEREAVPADADGVFVQIGEVVAHVLGRLHARLEGAHLLDEIGVGRDDWAEATGVPAGYHVRAAALTHGREIKTDPKSRRRNVTVLVYISVNEDLAYPVYSTKNQRRGPTFLAALVIDTNRQVANFPKVSHSLHPRRHDTSSDDIRAAALVQRLFTRLAAGRVGRVELLSEPLQFGQGARFTQQGEVFGAGHGRPPLRARLDTPPAPVIVVGAKRPRKELLWTLMLSASAIAMRCISSLRNCSRRYSPTIPKAFSPSSPNAWLLWTGCPQVGLRASAAKEQGKWLLMFRPFAQARDLVFKLTNERRAGLACWRLVALVSQECIELLAQFRRACRNGKSERFNAKLRVRGVVAQAAFSASLEGR